MVVILASTKTVSRQIETPVTGIKLEKSIQTYTRYIDHWQKLEIKATATPYTAKNKTVNYTCVVDANTEDEGHKARFAAENVSIDADTGLVTIIEPNDGLDYSGKYNIIIKTNDGGYRVQVDLILKYFYAQKLEFTNIYREGETYNHVQNGNIKVLLGSKFFTELTIEPDNINYQVVHFEIENPKILKIESREFNGATQTIQLKALSYGETNIIAKYYKGDEATTPLYECSFHVQVVESIHEKKVEDIQIIEGIHLDTPYKLNDQIDIHDIIIRIQYQNGYYEDEEYRLNEKNVSGDVIGSFLKTDIAGTHSFTVLYDGFSKTFSYSVLEKEINKVIVTGTLQGESIYDEDENKHSLHFQVKRNDKVQFKDFYIHIQYQNQNYDDEYQFLTFDMIKLESGKITATSFDTSTLGTIRFTISNLDNVEFTIEIMEDLIVNITLQNYLGYYHLDEAFPYHQVQLYVEYSYASYNKVVEVTETMVTGFTTSSLGPAEFYVTYGGFTKSFDYIVDEKTTSQMVIDGSFQLNIVKDTPLDVSRLQFLVQNTDDTYKIIDFDDVTIVKGEFTSITLGRKEVIVRYGGYNYVLHYTVWENQTQIDELYEEKVISSLEYIGQKNYYLNYDVNKIKERGIVKITYQNAKFEPEYYYLDSPELSVSPFQSNMEGTQEVTIQYRGSSFVVDFTFGSSEIQKLFLDSQFSTVYVLNENVDISNEWIWVKYANGTFEKKKIADFGLNIIVPTDTLGKHIVSLDIYGQTFTIYYQVVSEGTLPTVNENFELSTLYFQNQYRIGDIVNVDSLVILLESDENNILFEHLSADALEGEVLCITEGEYELSFTYQSQTLQIPYVVLTKEIEKIEISGLEQFYELNETILLEQLYVKFYYSNGYGIEVRGISVEDINQFDGDVLHSNQFKTDEVGTYRFKMVGYDTIFSYQVKYPTVKEINIISGFDLDKGLILHESLDLSKILIEIIFEKSENAPIRVTLDQMDDIVIPDITTTGIKELKIGYYDYEETFTFEVHDIKVVSVKLKTLFEDSYLLYQTINLDSYIVMVQYNNGSSEELPLQRDMIKGSFGTDSISKKEFTIQYENVESGKYSYTIIGALSRLENKTTWSLDFAYQININRSALAYLGYAEYTLSLEYDENVISVLRFEKQANGSYELQGKFNTTTLGARAVIRYQLQIDGITFDQAMETTIVRDVMDFDLSYPSKIKVGSTNQVSIRTDDTETSFTYVWRSSNPDILSITGSGSTISIIGQGAGSAEIVVTIYFDGRSQEERITIDVIETYEGLDFVLKPNGITEYVAIGKDNYDPDNHQAIQAVHIFDMIEKDSNRVPVSEVIFYIVDPATLELVQELEGIASIVDGSLIVHSDLQQATLIRLKAISKGNVELGLTNESNYVSLQLMLVPGMNVDSYEAILYATKNNLKVVLTKDIDIGENLMTITTSPTGVTSREININIAPEGNYPTTDAKLLAAYKEAARILASEVSSMPTTADYSYYNNNNLGHPRVKYCLELTNDVYGNGYTLDTKNITTVLDKYTFTPITYEGIEVTPFRGPLNLVWLQGDSSVGASVKAQDNIAFLIRNDNVRLDNVILQACDDAFLYEQKKEEVYVEMNHLNYVGTTLEIMGDNVDITNCRIKNGRTVVRIYGDAHSEDPTSVEAIHVKIESTIISMGREFLLKMGTNQFKKGELPEGATQSNPGWEGVSPYLVGSDGTTYYPSNQETYKYKDTTYTSNESYNANNTSFVNEFVKTFVTLKNCVFTHSGFFSVGLESQFAGPCLDGLKYGSYDFKSKGWYGIAGTSYSAMLTLQGDVRIYDWKALDSVDSSTLIDGDIFKFDVSGLFNYLVNEVDGYEHLLTRVGTNSDDIYVHGGVAMYGGGKNYHIVRNEMGDSKFPKAPYYISMMEFASDNFIQSEYVQSNFASLYKALPYASGKEAFKFYIYDNREESLTYQKQQQDLSSSAAYEIIIPVIR